jgi:hypothetical protein
MDVVLWLHVNGTGGCNPFYLKKSPPKVGTPIIMSYPKQEMEQKR